MGPASLVFSFSQYIFQALQIAAIGWGVRTVSCTSLSSCPVCCWLTAGAPPLSS
jgi:hypothetical protein